MEDNKINVADVVPEATNSFPVDPIDPGDTKAFEDVIDETTSIGVVDDPAPEPESPKPKKKMKKGLIFGLAALLVAVVLGGFLLSRNNSEQKVNNDKTADKETVVEAVKTGELDEIQMELTKGEFLQYEEGGKPIDTLSLVKFTNLSDKDSKLTVKASKETIDPSKEGDVAVKYTVSSDDTESEFTVIFSVVKDVAAAQSEARSQQTSFASGSGTATQRPTVTNKTTTVNGSNGTWKITTTSRRTNTNNNAQTSANESAVTTTPIIEEPERPIPTAKPGGTTPIQFAASGPNTENSANNSGSINTNSNDTSRSNTTTKPVAPSQPSTPTQHVHNWVPITTTVHHDAVTHVVHHDAVYSQNYVVDQPAQYGNMIVCVTCGSQFGTTAEFWEHEEATDGEHGNYTIKEVMISDEVGHYEDVLVSAAWDETVTDSAAWDETVTTGYQCSECGASQ